MLDGMSITWAGLFGEDLWFLIYIMNNGIWNFHANFFAYIFGSIQFDLWRFLVNISQDLWSAVMWLMQLVRGTLKKSILQTTLEGNEFSVNFPNTFNVSISYASCLVFQFWLIIPCVMPVISLIFRGSRTKVHYRELHCDSHDLDWPSRPMVQLSGCAIYGWVVIYFKIPQNVQYVYFRFVSLKTYNLKIYTCKCEI